MNYRKERVEIGVESGEHQHTIYFETQGIKLYLSPESIIAATLLPSMKLGKSLAKPDQADKKFLNSLDQIQDIFATWDSSFKRVSVDAKPVNIEIKTNRGVGTFFTGGVDSFYTLLKHKDEITHLIYVHGFENHKITTEIKSIADLFQKEVIEIETNLREFSDPIVTWYFYHGAALATIGHLLKRKLGKIFIPSSDTYINLHPWGSHPLVDPLWSDTSLSFIHDGCEASRLDKVDLIANYDDALNSLRVCWKDTEEIQNCGKCEKCIRTMISLKAIGSLEKCSTFPNTIPIGKVARILASEQSLESEYQDIYKSLKSGKVDRKLVSAVWWALHQPRFTYKIRQLISRIRS